MPQRQMPRQALKALVLEGLKFIDPVLLPYGFRLDDVRMEMDEAGIDSAIAEYVKDNRRLVLSHGFGRGLDFIRYYCGELWLDHEEYLRHLGVYLESAWLWL